MSGRVLVTRPEPGAGRTARRLATAGFEPLLLPLTEIVPLSIEASLPTRIDAVVATSANALRHCAPELIAGLTGTVLFAVGSETGSVARKLGFATVVDGPGSARELAKEVADRLGPGAQLVFLCGKVRLADFEMGLQQSGIAAQAVETYDTSAISYTVEDVAAVIGREPVAAVLLYSIEAARAYERAFLQPGLADRVVSALHICLSARVASGLARTDPARIAIAGAPTEDALFSLLEGQSPRRTQAGPFSA